MADLERQAARPTPEPVARPVEAPGASLPRLPAAGSRALVAALAVMRTERRAEIVRSLQRGGGNRQVTAMLQRQSNPGGKDADPGFVGGSLVYFKKGTTEIADGDQQAYLGTLLLQGEDATAIEVHGHAGEEGPTAASDAALAQRRAETIARLFETSGAPTTPKVVGHGRVAEPSLEPMARSVEIKLAVPHGGPAGIAQAYAEVAKLLEQQLAQIDANISKIGNRQKVLTADIERAKATVAGLNGWVQEGRALVAEAELATGAARDAKLDAASARFEGVILYAQVTFYDVAFLIVADVADDAGVPSNLWMRLLSAHESEMRPLRSAVKALDRKAMAAAAASGAGKFKAATKLMNDFIAQMKIGAKLSGQVIAALDAAMIVYSIYQAGGAIRSSRGGPGVTVRVAAIGEISGGAAAGVAVTIPAEVLEAIRQLIRIGAISSAVVSMGVPTSQIQGPLGGTVMMRATPSSTVTPTKGPDSGKAAQYGDTRNKHTRVGDQSQADIENAVKNPAGSTGPLKDLTDAIKAKDKTYGSQLFKEATDKYGDLVKDALENGTRKSPTWIDHTAPFDVGIDILTGKTTRNYRMFFAAPKGGWHLFPVP
jgi:hypothetical protein